MIKQIRSSGTLLLLGVSSRSVLDARLEVCQLLPQRIIIIDPDADKMLVEHEGATRLPALPAQDTAQKDLQVFSALGLRSTVPPTGKLFDLLPGLRVKENRNVQGIAPKDFLNDIEPLNDPLHIWIDTLGETKPLLDALSSKGVLDRVETIALRCGSEVFFDGDCTAAEMQSYLSELGFDVVQVIGEDPDFPDLHMRQDVLAKSARALAEKSKVAETFGARVEELEAKLAKIIDNQKTTKRALEDTQLQLVKQAETAEAATKQLAQTKNGLTRAEQMLSKQREKASETEAALQESNTLLSRKTDQIKALEASQLQLVKQAETAEAATKQLAQTENSLTRAEQMLSKQREKASETEAALQESNTLLSQKTDEIKAIEEAKTKGIQRERQLRSDLGQRMQHDQEMMKRLERDAAQSQRNLSIMLEKEMRTLREIELLQIRCKTLNEEKERMRYLLEQLTPRLHEAARHLKSLPDVTNDAAEPDISDTKPLQS